MRPQLARRPRRARPRRRCSMRSRARPPPRCSNRRAWSGRDRSSANCKQMITVKVLFFDVFGPLVDFRTGVAREAETILARAGHRLDWLAFADAWRNEYQPAMEEIRAGSAPFCKLDVLHRRNLDRILPRFGVSGLSDELTDGLNLAWHRLDAWPDVAVGLARLKQRFMLAPVSNGNISLMV